MWVAITILGLIALLGWVYYFTDNPKYENKGKKEIKYTVKDSFLQIYMILLMLLFFVPYFVRVYLSIEKRIRKRMMR